MARASGTKLLIPVPKVSSSCGMWQDCKSHPERPGIQPASSGESNPNQFCNESGGVNPHRYTREPGFALRWCALLDLRVSSLRRGNAYFPVSFQLQRTTTEENRSLNSRDDDDDGRPRYERIHLAVCGVSADNTRRGFPPHYLWAEKVLSRNKNILLIDSEGNGNLLRPAPPGKMC